MSQGLGKQWDQRYRNDDAHRHQADAPAFALAAQFLNAPEVVTVEDWGCGMGPKGLPGKETLYCLEK